MYGTDRTKAKKEIPVEKPQCCKLSAERMRKMNSDPAFKEKISKLSAERMRKMHSDPAFNPLAALNQEQRDEYNILVKKGGYKREEAFNILGVAAPATTPPV